MNLENLNTRRLEAWRQDRPGRCPDPVAGADLVRELGFCTLYPACTEVPNLLHAYVGDPGYKSVPQWDSPGGEVYGWRWEIGKIEAAYYGLWIAKKPTWVSWEQLPSVLGAFMERREPEDLYAAGELSADAAKIARALKAAGTSLLTAELRDAAGYPTGKEHRAAYVKGLEELELKMLVAKRFNPEGEMGHGWVRSLYPEAVERGLSIAPDDALRGLLAAVLPRWVYVETKPLARGLRIDEARLLSVLTGVPGESHTVEKRRFFVPA